MDKYAQFCIFIPLHFIPDLVGIRLLLPLNSRNQQEREQKKRVSHASNIGVKLMIYYIAETSTLPLLCDIYGKSSWVL
jgi:hypothetical protein